MITKRSKKIAHLSSLNKFSYELYFFFIYTLLHTVYSIIVITKITATFPGTGVSSLPWGTHKRSYNIFGGELYST